MLTIEQAVDNMAFLLRHATSAKARNEREHRDSQIASDLELVIENALELQTFIADIRRGVSGEFRIPPVQTGEAT